MSDGMDRFLGDSPLRVLVKLVVVSILVGFVMRMFGWYPTDIYFAVRNFLLDLWYTGFAALGRVGDYLLLGAVIVVLVIALLAVVFVGEGDDSNSTTTLGIAVTR